MATKILMIHIDLESNNVGIQFAKLDGNGNVSGRARHQGIKLSDSLISELTYEVNTQLDIELATMEHIPSHLLTSELHKVREARGLQEQIKSEMQKEKDIHVDTISKIQEEIKNKVGVLKKVKEEIKNTKRE